MKREQWNVPRSNVLKFRTICAHGLVDPRPVGPPWPRQVDWRGFLRRAKEIDA